MNLNQAKTTRQSPQQSSAVQLPLTGSTARAHREQVQLVADSLSFGQQKHVVTVKNVSVGGFCAENSEAPPVGSQMVLEVEGIGQFPALVRWTQEGSFGARFNGRLGIQEKELIATLVRSNRRSA